MLLIIVTRLRFVFLAGSYGRISVNYIFEKVNTGSEVSGVPV